MARKTRQERLFGAAVLKLSFQLKGQAESEGFQAIYRGVLTDLDLDDQDVDAYLNANRPQVLGRVQETLATQPGVAPADAEEGDG